MGSGDAAYGSRLCCCSPPPGERFSTVIIYVSPNGLFLPAMENVLAAVLMEQKIMTSSFLGREVIVDFYLPKNINDSSGLSLLLINDGQDLPKMQFDRMLDEMIVNNHISPLLCVGIHAGKDRRLEYGTAKILDYKNRGAKAAAYNQFILEELLPYVHTQYLIESFKHMAIAGFSLGGLAAIDMAWNYPNLFSIAGVFSGSLWWRTKDLREGYNEETDRIMHQQVRDGEYYRGQRFYFATGSLDEKADRNGNGIIDSIDDTLALINELKALGYKEGSDIQYINFEDGRHDVFTWGRAMPKFLKWGWGR